MRCQKCGYVRKAEDMAPEWQCPSCQVAYAKVSDSSSFGSMRPAANIPAPSRTGSSPAGMLKGVVVLALVACVGYFGYSFVSGITITSETTGGMVEASPIIAQGNSVLFYTAAGCRYCDQAREFLKKHDIKFEEIDINASDRGRQDFQQLGGLGTPIIVVADTRIVGFNEGELKNLLKSKGQWK